MGSNETCKICWKPQKIYRYYVLLFFSSFLLIFLIGILESQVQGRESEFSGNLYWDSWEHSSSGNSRRHQRSSVSSSSEGEGPSNPSSPPLHLPPGLGGTRFTPPPTPPSHKGTKNCLLNLRYLYSVYFY